MPDQDFNGFSKWSRDKKIKWLTEHFTNFPVNARKIISDFQLRDDLQEVLESFSENTLSTFPLPYGIAPHFLINGREYSIPMVIEESSVVAAASAAAKFWKKRGGFQAQVIETQKIGQVYFQSEVPHSDQLELLEEFESHVFEETNEFTANMRNRGGGISGIELSRLPEVDGSTYQLKFYFQTCDSMGANFINSILEQSAKIWKDLLEQKYPDNDTEVMLAILSNYTPNCLVKAEVSCKIDDLGDFPNGITAEQFARRFQTAVQIARNDVYRATTHNKGIYNGIDAVVIATGNDFRAVEAAGHAYAARTGQYRSLTNCSLEGNVFHFWLEVPLSVGTVGGLTKLHPMAALSLEILRNPNASELMQIIASMGLAQNFSAIRSLVTVGIQRGHMKMHLNNILQYFSASPEESKAAIQFFDDHVVSFTAVRKFLEQRREVTSRSSSKDV